MTSARGALCSHGRHGRAAAPPGPPGAVGLGSRGSPCAAGRGLATPARGTALPRWDTLIALPTRAASPGPRGEKDAPPAPHPAGGIPGGSCEALGWGDSSGASPEEGGLGPKAGRRGLFPPAYRVLFAPAPCIRPERPRAARS